MAGRKVIVTGFPSNCNPTKVKISLESQGNLEFASFKFHNADQKAEVEFRDDKDFQKFHQAMPICMKFGTTEHRLSLKKTETVKSQDEVGTEENRHLQQAVSNFKQVHDWVSVQSLLKSSCTRCILVQPHTDISPKCAMQYFQDFSKSKGDAVTHMLLMIDGFIIIFQRESTIDDVLAAKPHNIDGKQIAVYLKEIPQNYNDRIVLKNTMHLMREDAIKMSLQNCSQKDQVPEPSSIERHSQNVLLVKYKEPLESEDLQEIVRGAKEQYGEENSQVLALPKPDCLLVQGVDKDTRNRELQAVLENKHQTGGGKVTRIDRARNKEVLVYFSSFRDTEAIHEKFKNSTLEVFGQHFKIELYVHWLSDVHKHLTEENAIDRYNKKWQDRTTAPEAFEYTDISAELHSFFFKKEEHIQLLKNTLQDIADVKFVTDRQQPHIKVTPVETMTYQERPSDHFSFREKCMQGIKTFLASYKTATVKSIKIENLQKVRQSNVHKRLTDSDEEDVCIKWTGNHNEILVVTGLQAEVDSTLTEILQLIDIMNATMDLKKEKIRWLSRCGYIDKIRRDGNFVRIQCYEDLKQIVFSGNERQVAKARLALTTHLVCLSSDKVDYLTPSINNFLLKERNKDKVLSKLTMSFKKKGLKAIVEVQGKVACMWTHEDHLQEAKALMKDVFSEKSVSLSPEGYQDVTKLSAWSDFKTTEEKDGLVQIDVKGSNVHIVGFKSKATEAHMKIASFLDENCMREELFETEYGIGKFIVEKDSNFGAHCRANCVQYSVKHGPKNGVLLQGKKKNLQRAMSKLVRREARTRRKPYKLEKFMIGNYLKREKGKSTVNQAEQDNECIILLGNDGYPHEQVVELADECKEEDFKQANIFTEPYLGRSLRSAMPRERVTYAEAQSHLGGASGSAVPTGSISVSVHQGNIVDEKNEVIVNSTDSKFDLSQGQVAKALIARGGSQILHEVQNASGTRIRVTNGGNLSCKKIFHVAVPQNPQLIGDCVMNILEEAESQKFTSISIPALGTGASKLPLKEVAQSMLEGFKEFISKHRQTKHLKKVNVILYEKVKFLQFQEWLGPVTSAAVSPVVQHRRPIIGETPAPVFVTPTTASSSSSPASSRVVGPVTVSVRQGDITDEKNDAIINITGTDFDLSQGLVAKAIVCKGGSQIQTDVKAASGPKLRVTSGGSLCCKKIFHVVGSNIVKDIGDCVMSILNEAERQQCASVSIPAIGTGTQNVAGAMVADVMLETFQEFAKQNPQTKYLKKVDIVIFDRTKIQDFLTGIINVPSGSSNTAVLGPINITVRQGDITKENNDAIVNIVGNDFNLSSAGLVAKAILSKGGSHIQTDVKAASGSKLRVTTSGNLPCKKIFHVAAGSNNLKDIGDCVMNILNEAERQQCVSVSIPAIGTGNQSMQSSSVAKEMCETFQEFVKQNPQTNHLKKVDVVIFDQSKIQDFRTGIISALQASTISPVSSASTSSPQSTPKKRVSSSGGFGSLTVSVRQGDITDESNDAIVNSTGSNFSLSTGLVAGAIIRKGGRSIQDEVNAASGTDIRVTNAGNLKCKKIFHVAFPNSTNRIKTSILKLLHEIEKEKCRSVSIPAVGTGNKGISDSAIASTVTEAIQQFAQAVPQTQYLKVIDLVIYDTAKLQAFEQAIGSVQSSAQGSQQSSTRTPQQQESEFKYMEITGRPKSQVKPKKPRENTMMFYIYAQKKDKLDKAWKMIQAEVNKAYMDHPVHVSDYDQLTASEFSKIEELADENDVQLIKKKAQKEIVLTGLRSEVMNASKIISGKITTFSKAKAVKSHAHFAWQYKDSNQAWVDFPSTANTALEESHKNTTDLQKKVKLNLDFEDVEQECEVDFMNMKMFCGGRPVKIQRYVKIELPRHWEDMKGKDHLVVPLSSNSDEYIKVKNEMTKTLPNCQIISISRIQNKKQYIHYRDQKKMVENSVKNKPLEHQLFHGTKADTSQKIIDRGFNRSYCGGNVGAMYGRGVYFAKNAKYSSADKYSTPDGNGVRTMLLADVITGDYCQGKTGLIALDPKPVGGSHYESAVDKMNNPEIFVVFEDASAYPAYLIKYKL